MNRPSLRVLRYDLTCLLDFTSFSPFMREVLFSILLMVALNPQDFFFHLLLIVGD